MAVIWPSTERARSSSSIPPVSSGIEVGRVVIPGDASNVTHVAIESGTRRAFVTASGPGGGSIYAFPALAPAPAGAPNGR
jgi:hypothetical protein